jgi:hypothetical protein
MASKSTTATVFWLSVTVAFDSRRYGWQLGERGRIFFEKEIVTVTMLMLLARLKFRISHHHRTKKSKTGIVKSDESTSQCKKPGHGSGSQLEVSMGSRKQFEEVHTFAKEVLPWNIAHNLINYLYHRQ